MKNITIQNLDGNKENVKLLNSFDINELNKTFAILYKDEALKEGMSKVYISELVENTPGSYKFVNITDESIWDKVKQSMKEIVQGGNVPGKAFNGNIVINEGCRVIGIKDVDRDKLASYVNESSFDIPVEQPVATTVQVETPVSETSVAPVVPEEENIFDKMANEEAVAPVMPQTEPTVQSESPVLDIPVVPVPGMDAPVITEQNVFDNVAPEVATEPVAEMPAFEVPVMPTPEVETPVVTEQNVFDNVAPEVVAEPVAEMPAFEVPVMPTPEVETPVVTEQNVFDNVAPEVVAEPVAEMPAFEVPVMPIPEVETPVVTEQNVFDNVAPEMAEEPKLETPQEFYQVPQQVETTVNEVKEEEDLAMVYIAEALTGLSAVADAIAKAVEALDNKNQMIDSLNAKVELLTGELAVANSRLQSVVNQVNNAPQAPSEITEGGFTRQLINPAA